MGIGATTLTAFGTLALSLAAGLLVGMERGWRTRERSEGDRVAGLRTFGILGFAGGLSGLLSSGLSPWFPAVGLLAVTVLLAVAYTRGVRARADRGMTTELAALATFMLGVAATTGFVTISAAGAVLLTILLGLKEELHRWLARLDRNELIAAFQMLLISVVVLPLLPDRAVGPWDALNPYHLWWMVVLIAGISFVGHFAIRLAGERRGLLLTGFFGGLASSTALTLEFSRFGRAGHARPVALATAVLFAGATMFPRMLVEVAAVNPALLQTAALPLLAMAAAGYGTAAIALFRLSEKPAETEASFGGAFRLRAALQFAALLAVIGILGEVAAERFGDRGVYVLALLSGIADVDAITLSLGRLARGDVAGRVAVNGMVIAAISNTAVKAALAVVIARGRMARVVMAGSGAMIVTGLATLGLY